MSRAAWDRLLGAARAAHARPPLSGFCPFPDDLRGTDVAARRVPAAALMEADESLAACPDPLAGAFLAAAPAARWRETYRDTDIGADFLDRFGCYCLIGPGGAFDSGKMHAYVVYMPPGLHYPWHHHPGEELYLVLHGRGTFRREGEPPEELGPGQWSEHASGQPHALTTGEGSLMAYVVWRSHLDTGPALTRRPVRGDPGAPA